MVERKNAKFDLEDRLLEFAARIVRLAESLLDETDQLIRIFRQSILTSRKNARLTTAK